MSETELFFIDTQETVEESADVKPQYDVDHSLVADDGEASSGEEQDKYARGSCWNCGKGGHSLRECTEEADYAMIEKQRKLFMNNKPSGSLSKRYHDDKFSRFRAGYVSRALREALGLRRNEVPCFVYAMRRYGYPPGWLAEAKISSSGMNMYGTTGKRIPEPDEEEGEIIRKTMKYDVEKLIDFPGFNVPLREGCKDDHRKLGYPPMQPEHSKEEFIKYLEELSSREVDEEPYENSPDRRSCDLESDEDGPIRTDKRRQVVPTKNGFMVLVENNPTPPPRSSSSASGESPTTKVAGPVTSDGVAPAGPMTRDGSPPCPASPTVGPKTPGGTPPASPATEAVEAPEEPSQEEPTVTSPAVKRPISEGPEEEEEGAGDGPSAKKSARLSVENEETKEIVPTEAPKPEEPAVSEPPSSPTTQMEVAPEETMPTTPVEKPNTTEAVTPSPVHGTPTTPTGPILLGTPNIKKHSPFAKLPAFTNFGKDISDVIDFENLPDSVGKYKSLCSVVDKVREFMATKNKRSSKS